MEALTCVQEAYSVDGPAPSLCKLERGGLPPLLEPRRLLNGTRDGHGQLWKAASEGQVGMHVQGVDRQAMTLPDCLLEVALLVELVRVRPLVAFDPSRHPGASQNHSLTINCSPTWSRHGVWSRSRTSYPRTYRTSSSPQPWSGLWRTRAERCSP